MARTTTERITCRTEVLRILKSRGNKLVSLITILKECDKYSPFTVLGALNKLKNESYITKYQSNRYAYTKKIVKETQKRLGE